MTKRDEILALAAAIERTESIVAHSGDREPGSNLSKRNTLSDDLDAARLALSTAEARGLERAAKIADIEEIQQDVDLGNANSWRRGASCR